MSRPLTLIYGALCYAVFLAVFVYSLGFIGGFLTPTRLDAPPVRPVGEAVAIDLALLAAFAFQHSGMARPAFKRWWTHFVPQAAERSTYVLASSIALAAFFVLWQPIGGVLWRVPDGPALLAVTGLFLVGCALLLWSTFLIDHYELFGLRQGWNALTGRPDAAPAFHTPSLYRLVRHPLYVGWLVIFWAAPVMTVAHLIFAVGMTVYILVAIRWEERDLVATFGRTYEDYRRATPMLIPRPRRAGTKTPPPGDRRGARETS